MPIITMENVCKQYSSYKRQKGFVNSVKSLFVREAIVKEALKDMSFNIEPGELVGYIGPNGAGKSTTIKILAGVLVPSSGQVLVHGMVPHQNRKANAMKIGVVFGQRSQVYWDLPLSDTLDLYRRMYKVDPSRFKENVEFFTEMLEMAEFMHKPVRQLSLGQKMRVNLAVSLLHDPEILYLDEPTIGLDVVAKHKVRCFIRELRRIRNTTVILTTHDMDDIESICDRIIMIDRGTKLYDGSLQVFKDSHAREYMIVVEFQSPVSTTFRPEFTVASETELKKSFMFRKDEISTVEAMSYFINNFPVTDITLKEPDIEETVRQLYQHH